MVIVNWLLLDAHAQPRRTSPADRLTLHSRTRPLPPTHTHTHTGVLDTVLGPSHAESLLTANQLALLVKDNGGDQGEAEALFKRCV